MNGKSIGAAIGAFSGNHEEMYEIVDRNNQKYEPVKVVAALHKLFTMCRWADVSGGGTASSSESQ